METLQIFGAADAAIRKNDPDSYKSNLRNYKGSDAFLANGISANLSSGTCSLTYSQPGDPFRIELEEPGVKTACNLVTYIPEEQEDIPFDMLGISFKIIMESRHLLDALAEIVPTTPDKLTIAVSKKAPYLLLKSTGSMGSTSVDFAKGKHLFESFEVRERWKETFHFDLIKATTEAMRVASKVSLRGDPEGVLNLQFMVEVDGAKNYLEYRLVAYSSLGESGSEDEDDQEEVPEST
jgi:cell cycle checkpoint protein